MKIVRNIRSLILAGLLVPAFGDLATLNHT